MTNEKIIEVLEKQFNKIYPHYRLEVIEFEWEENGEKHFNLIANGHNYQVMVVLEEDKVYWDRCL